VAGQSQVGATVQCVPTRGRQGQHVHVVIQLDEFLTRAISVHDHRRQWIRGRSIPALVHFAHIALHRACVAPPCGQQVGQHWHVLAARSLEQQRRTTCSQIAYTHSAQFLVKSDRRRDARQIVIAVKEFEKGAQTLIARPRGRMCR
jgi:hypothetical protein